MGGGGRDEGEEGCRTVEIGVNKRTYALKFFNFPNSPSSEGIVPVSALPFLGGVNGEDGQRAEGWCTQPTTPENKLTSTPI